MAAQRILHLVHTPGPGGTEQVVLNLLRWMPAASFTQSLGAPRGELGEAAEAIGITFYDIPFQQVQRPRSMLRFAASLGSVRATMRALRQAIDLADPAIVHSHGAKPTILSGIVGGRERPWKLIWHLHDYLPLGLFRPTIVTTALRHADGVVAVSADVGRSVCGDHAVRVIPNAIGTAPGRNGSRSSELRAAYGIPVGNPVLGYAGRLDREKGIAMLLDSMTQSETSSATLFLAGESPFQPQQMRSLWEEEARKRDLTHRVHFLGRLPDLADFFQAIDVFVLPAPREPFGLVVLEAFAHGVPVVACDAGGPREIIGALEWSQLVPPYDPSAFAAAFDRLLDSKELRRRASEEGPRIVRDRYSPDVQTQAVASLYREVLSQ